jgi:hypothetical protein
MTTHPPYPLLALQVGITGHRKLDDGASGQAGLARRLG